MHWLVYLVLAVGMVFVVIVDLASGRWARAALSALGAVFLGLAAWNARAREKAASALAAEADPADASRD